MLDAAQLDPIQVRRYQAVEMVLEFSRGKAWSFNEVIVYADQLEKFVANGIPVVNAPEPATDK